MLYKVFGHWEKSYLSTRKKYDIFTCENIISASQSKTTYEIYLTTLLFSPLPGLDFCKIHYCFFDEQKDFLSNIFYEHGYNFREHYRRHVERLIQREENENTRKKRTLCRTFVGKHETSCFTWNGIHSMKSRKSAVYLVYSAVSRQLITGGTLINVHVAANSSTESNTTASQSPKCKIFRQLRPLESSDSIQGDSQYVI